MYFQFKNYLARSNCLVGGKRPKGMFEQPRQHVTTLSEILTVLQEAREKGKALTYSVREAIESARGPGSSGMNSTIDLDKVLASPDRWRRDPLMDGAFWAQSGDKMIARTLTKVTAFDGRGYRQRERISVGVDDVSKEEWVVNDYFRIGQAEMGFASQGSLNPLFVGGALPSLSGMSSESAWLCDVLAKKPVTLRDLPNGRVEATILVQPSSFGGPFDLDHLNTPVYWDGGQKYVLTLDPKRDYLLESSSLRMGRSEVSGSRVFDARRVGGVWLPRFQARSTATQPECPSPTSKQRCRRRPLRRSFSPATFELKPPIHQTFRLSGLGRTASGTDKIRGMSRRSQGWWSNTAFTCSSLSC
jgi:hypothetical protein